MQTAYITGLITFSTLNHAIKQTLSHCSSCIAYDTAKAVAVVSDVKGSAVAATDYLCRVDSSANDTAGMLGHTIGCDIQGAMHILDLTAVNLSDYAYIVCLIGVDLT